ncbi:uncharacterized protein TNCV_53531 [Trichonephila clavipes]|nr:uncharacterized protein TNCV_53531 [Trichonephila clavipes]
MLTYPEARLAVTNRTPIQGLSYAAVAKKVTTSSVCCLYLPPNVVIRQQDLNDLVDQLPAPFVILGDFNGHSTLWGSVKTNHRGRQIEQVIDSLRPCLDKEPVLPRSNVNGIAANTRFLILSFSNNDMSKQSPFAIHKALIGIGGEPNSVKRLRSGDLLIETNSALQTKSFLLAKSFLDSPITISPHKTLNSCRGVISESDLLTTPDTEILDGFSDQGVIQVRRITIKKDNSVIPTKHLILTFNRPKLPTTIKAGYLNCKIRPYIPNPLRCFKCQRFGHSQNSCRGQLTCSRCAAVGHSSTDCTLEPKCINCSQIHTADSKLCPKWKTEKEIQAIKTNNNITYVEARKLIVPQTSHTYAQAAKSSNKTSSTQTDEIITKN